jgi:hypothetical protein
MSASTLPEHKSILKFYKIYFLRLGVVVELDKFLTNKKYLYFNITDVANIKILLVLGTTDEMRQH